VVVIHLLFTRVHMGGDISAFMRANNFAIIPTTRLAISFVKFVATKFRNVPRIAIPFERVAIAGLVSTQLLCAYVVAYYAVALGPRRHVKAGGSTLASGLIACAIFIIGASFTLAIHRAISRNEFVRYAGCAEACLVLVRS
jgi:hypothetical protein